MPVPSQLNHYKILRPLGKGGMGEVFVAEDTRLHRQIALKVLPTLMAGDPERRQRFEREAQAVAALNHPNIVTIHSVEEADGVPFLTMELVEGKTLSETMSRAGMPLDALLKVGISISDAIAAAHQRGITHRDLKPANVMVTNDGRVKVLDFGLAKLREDHAAGNADDVTHMPGADLTGEGRIIGTVAYMSPEQAEGKPVDQRSDIFSLGVMLHEMATGQRPFKGDTNVSVISSILKDNPTAITDLNPELPQGLARVIRRTLSKDPSRRYQTATDLRNELEELKEEADSGVTTSTGVTRQAGRQGGALNKIAITCSLILVLTAGVIGYVYWNKSRTVAAPVSFEADRFTRLTSSGGAFLAAVSPDGRYVAHVKTTGTMPALWVRQTATTSDVQIVPPAQVRYDGVTFAPDGDHVYFVTYTLSGGVATLYRVPILGGTAQRVIEDVDSRISFSPDRRQFAFVRGAPSLGKGYVMVANADGTGARELASIGGSDRLQLHAPSWSPDGRTILAPVGSIKGGAPHSLVVAVDATTGAVTRLHDQWTVLTDIEWLPDGGSFAAVGGELGEGASQIWQVPYPQGERRRITNDLNTYLSVSFSGDGKSLLTVQAEATSNLWVAQEKDLAGGRQITTGRERADGLSGLTWTPDGRLVYGSSASGRPEIWISNADGSGAHQLTNDPAPSLHPDVTPDGRYIVFHRFTKAGGNIWRMGIDGSDAKQLTHSAANMAPQATNAFVYYVNPTSGSPRPWKVPIDGGDPVSLGDHHLFVTGMSPDGTRLLGNGWDQTGRRPVTAIMPIEGGPPQFVPEITSYNATWSADGRGLTYWGPHEGALQLFRYVPGEKAALPLARFKDEVFAFAWSPDGKRAALARGQASSDVVLITRKEPGKN